MDNITVEELMLKLKSVSISEHEEALIDALGNLTSLMQSSLRNDLKAEHWNVIGKLSVNASNILLKENKSDKELEFLTSLLRFLRNSCGGSFENQDNLLKTPAVINFAKESLKLFLDAKSVKEKLILKISIQLFGNILLCNEKSQDFVWEIVFHKGLLFRKLFSLEDSSIKECAMMVLFHCLNGEKSKFLCSNTDDETSILHFLIDLYMKNEVEWIPDVMKYLLEQDALFSSYTHLDSFQRCVLLEAIYMHLEEDKNEKTLINSMQTLMNIFEKEISDTVHSLIPFEIMKILSILCRASVIDSYMPTLQNNKELLKSCLGSLKVVHLLRSQNNSSFSTESESYHGFKSQLIQLIGNLSYKCKENQNLVRSLDGIPLILDCCRLDEDNPFIREWCILAIRNLLENNLENQAIIAGISSDGEVVQNEFLTSIGLEAQSEGGQIRIRPKPKPSSVENTDDQCVNV